MTDRVYAIIIGLLIPLNSVINPYVYSLNELTILIKHISKKIREIG